MFLILVALISGCASAPKSSLFPDDEAQCVSELSEYYRSVEASRGYALPYHFDGRFPYLAFDRFSTSMTDTLSGAAAKKQWLDYVSRLGKEQLEIALKLTPKPAGAVNLTQCQQALTAKSLNNAAFWQIVQDQSPRVPTAYQHWKRVVGVYPVASLVAEGRIEAEQVRIKEGFRRVLESPISYGEPAARLDQAKITGMLSAARQQSPTGWPLIDEDDEVRLLNHYSPVFKVETLTRDDLPGALELGRGDKPYINTFKPALYKHLSYTRFDGNVLPQLNYVLWFPGRPAASVFDPYAGRFDAVNVRITLDESGQPLILDSIHQCGCYHMVYLLSDTIGFRHLDGEKPIEQTLLLPQPSPRLTVSLTSGEHMIQGVSVTGNTSPDVALAGLPLKSTLALPTVGQTFQSPYDREGILPESVRGERWFLWPFGVRSPGAMRQHGKHAIAFVGERHFDDAHLFDFLLIRR